MTAASLDPVSRSIENLWEERRIIGSLEQPREDRMPWGEPFHPLMASAASRRALASLYLLVPGIYVERSLAKAMAELAGLTPDWCRRMLRKAKRAGAVGCAGKLGQKNLVVIEPARLALYWASFRWQRFDVTAPVVPLIAPLVAAQ